MSRIRSLRRRFAITPALEWAGYAAVAVGFGLIYFPVGIIVAGAALVFLAQGVEP